VHFQSVVGFCVAVTVVLGTPVLAQNGTVSQGESSVLPSSGLVPAEPNGANAPVLRSLVTLDLRNVTLHTALREISRQMGGRLMFDESVTSLSHRVTLTGTRVSSGRALREMLQGTNVEIFVSQGGQLVLLKNVPPPLQRQDSVTIRGSVVITGTSNPIDYVVVAIGSAFRAATASDGSFILRDVPVGRHTITFRRLGYTPFGQDIVLVSGRDTTLAIALSPLPSRLNDVVTTGAGEARRLEVGNSIVSVNVDSIMNETPAATVSELVANRLPSLLASRGTGAVGAPTRLRIRGLSSIESDNAPIIILDGVRISTDANNLSVSNGGGENDLSNRLDDIDPNSIESIEVLKGPAASTLYGSEAANGVIVIKSKRGMAGPARWRVYADHRTLSQVTDYEYPILQVGYPLTGGGPQLPNCSVAAVAQGTCLPQAGEYIGFNMLGDPRFTPQTKGHTQSFGGSVSGGNNDLQYYLGGTWLDQLGTTKLPKVNEQWITYGRGGKPLPEEITRPNARSNLSANARLTGNFNREADFALGASFISQYQRVGNDGMAGLVGNPRSASDTTPITTGWDGWNGQRTQNVKHVLGNAAFNWRPVWRNQQMFSANAVYGWDFSLNDDEYYVPRNSCTPLCNGTSDVGILGFVGTRRRSDLVQTLTLGTSLVLPVTSWLTTQSRFGGNYSRRKWNDLFASATNIGVGRKFTSATGTRTVTDGGDERALAGWYFEEQLGMRQDKLFVTFGLRQDAGSSFGDETQLPVFTKWNASWVASEERFFPLKNFIPMMRFRAALGNAGVMPGSNARIRTYAFQSNAVLDNGDPTGAFAELGAPGNPDLRAEHSREVEGGFDMELFDQLLSIDATWYRKNTRDALHRFPVAGSVGPSVVRVFLGNVGDIVNKGFEVGSTLRALERDALSYTITSNLTSRSNKLVRMADGVVTFISLSASGDLYTGNASKIAVGYPLFGRWAYPIHGWADTDGNGLIDPWEVQVGDSLQYVGATEPKYTAYMGHRFGFLRNRLTLNANFAYSNGMTQFNAARKTMSQRLSPAQGMGDLKDQACVVAATAYRDRRATDWCFMETVKVLRLQDLSVGYTLPSSLMRHLRASSASIHFNATNLRHWSNFNGRDPGVNTEVASGNAVEAGAAFAAPREYGARVQLTF
jgi:TonB-dependent SusC/RagA subfamily outer membrane receptor